MILGVEMIFSDFSEIFAAQIVIGYIIEFQRGNFIKKVNRALVVTRIEKFEPCADFLTLQRKFIGDFAFGGSFITATDAENHNQGDKER